MEIITPKIVYAQGYGTQVHEDGVVQVEVRG